MQSCSGRINGWIRNLHCSPQRSFLNSTLVNFATALPRTLLIYIVILWSSPWRMNLWLRGSPLASNLHSTTGRPYGSSAGRTLPGHWTWDWTREKHRFLLIVGFDFTKYPVGKPHDSIKSRESRTNFETTRQNWNWLMTLRNHLD